MIRKTLQSYHNNRAPLRNAWDHIRPVREDPNGDFDDFGRGEGAALYHYEQKRKHGRF
jgi:hypothetical protein